MTIGAWREGDHTEFVLLSTQMGGAAPAVERAGRAAQNRVRAHQSGEEWPRGLYESLL